MRGRTKSVKSRGKITKSKVKKGMKHFRKKLKKSIKKDLKITEYEKKKRRMMTVREKEMEDIKKSKKEGTYMYV